MVRAPLLLLLLSSPSCFAGRRHGDGLAFVPTSRGRTSAALRAVKGTKSKATKKMEISNEWGIPSSQTLEPLSSLPLNELPNGGQITLVGSGPGDPELLTLSAYRLLRDPDIMVIADRLVSDEIMDMIATKDVKVARKLPGCSELAQEEIYWWAHQGIKEGRHVVRLKIGDPFVFGRGGEEVLKFRGFGVEPSVVPVSVSLYMFCFNLVF